MKNKIQLTVKAAMFAALIFVATRFLQVPAPLNGYIHLGDCFVLLCGWFFPPTFSFLSAGIGSALSDLLSPYAIYTPVTFVIKGVMALIAGIGFKVLKDKTGKIPARIIVGILSGIVMIGGYYIFEGFMYGFGASLANIPANAVQAAGGVLFATILGSVFDGIKLFSK